MAKQSSGILLFRRDPDGLRFLLVKPGGPFFARRGGDPIWGIPKGEFDPDSESPEAAAEREFSEELGPAAPALGSLMSLGTVKQGSKVIHGFAAQGDFDTSLLQSNTFDLEFPRGSGKVTSYPEIDEAGWYDIQEVEVFMKPEQRAFVERLMALM